LDLQVRGADARARLVDLEDRLARAWSGGVTELLPRELIEVAAWARHHEPGWNRCRRTPASSAVTVYVPSEVRSIRSPIELEEAAIDRRQ
jgi:hypothetical protein